MTFARSYLRILGVIGLLFGVVYLNHRPGDSMPDFGRVS